MKTVLQILFWALLILLFGALPLKMLAWGLDRLAGLIDFWGWGGVL